MIIRKGLTLGQYLPVDSCVHRLDPRLKIIAAILITIIVFWINWLLGYILLLTFLIAVVCLGKVPWSNFFRGLLPIIYLALFTFIINLFFIKGEVLLKLGPIIIYKQALLFALLMMSRLAVIVIAFTCLTLTTSPLEITDAFEHLFWPLKKMKIPVHDIALMIAIALRFIPALLDEMERITKAQISRGADLDTGNLLRRTKNIFPIIIPLFLSVFRRADELATAMEARCYRGGRGRRKMKKLYFSKLDFLAMMAISLLLGILFVAPILLPENILIIIRY